MKLLNLKSTLLILAFSIFFYSCKSKNKTTENIEIAKDTITTSSGLKYFYLTKGNGKKVELGSKMSAQLSLKVNDSVIWTSYSSKDSVFSYIAGRGGVIKGYDEMALLLREGDNVVAILPSDIAYGDKGSGKVIPPKSTLIYDRFKVTYVGEPKLVLSDSLFLVLKDHGIKKMKSVYKQVTTTKDSILYHGGVDQLEALWRKLSRANMFKEANEAFTYFNKENNNTTFDFYIIRSLEKLEKLKEATVKVDQILKGKLSKDQKEYFLKYKQDLAKKTEK